ncbi:MAG: 50S ribosomal protein L10 [Candidatus ainarchaeum sp.]|nr:50S ribosomal protein L10 [Candidatus ainarchaeum sp.]
MALSLLNKKKLNAKEAKGKRAAAIAALAKKYGVIAVASLRNLPDKHLQAIRRKLRGQAEIEVAKNSVLLRALKEAGKAAELSPNIEGPTAIIFTDLDPFRLYKLIYQGRGKAAAKPGQTAPFDIIVPKGETAFPPGPVLTELKAAGINAQIQAGKVVIAKDSTVVKLGEKIGDVQAKALAKLGVEPFEVGMSLAAAWEGGTVYPGAVLHIDEAQFMSRLMGAANNAFNLTVEIAYPTKANVSLLVGKAVREGRALALEAGICGKDTIGLILAKANAEAAALKAKTGSG